MSERTAIKREQPVISRSGLVRELLADDTQSMALLVLLVFVISPKCGKIPGAELSLDVQREISSHSS